jgi:hypothetical protein
LVRPRPRLSRPAHCPHGAGWPAPHLTSMRRPSASGLRVSTSCATSRACASRARASPGLPGRRVSFTEGTAARRGHWSQCRELLLIAITYHLMLRYALAGFLQSKTNAAFPPVVILDHPPWGSPQPEM